MKKLFRQHLYKQSGFSTIEILVAVLILAVSFGAVITLVLGSQKLSIDTETNQVALRSAEKLLEDARRDIRNNFNAALPAVPALTPPFDSITLTGKDISECVREVTVSYGWDVEGRQQNITLKEQISDPSMPFRTGQNCEPSGPPGASPFENCFAYGNADLDGGDHDAFDVDLMRISSHDYVFVATHPKNQNRPEDFWIYNIDNNASPQLVPQQIDADASADKKGMNAVYVAKTIVSGSEVFTAYLVSENKQLISINVTNPSAIGTPFIKPLIGSPSDTANDVKYFDGKVYVAFGNTVQVFNASNLTLAPTVITLNGQANKLSFNSDNLFVATADAAGELIRISLSDFSNRTKYNADGTNQPGTTVAAYGSTLYLGRAMHANDKPNFIILKLAGSTFSEIAKNDLNHGNNTQIVDLLVVGNLAFVSSTDSNAEFEVYDISVPASPVKKCINGFNPPSIAYGLDYFNNFVYAAMRSNNELQIFADHAP